MELDHYLDFAYLQILTNTKKQRKKMIYRYSLNVAKPQIKHIIM